MSRPTCHRPRKLNALKSGLIPNLMSSLTSHAALAQQTADARAQHGALAHLLQCREGLRDFTRLVEKGELADATKASASLEGIIASAPEPLSKSEILTDMKVRPVARSSGVPRPSPDCAWQRKCITLRNRTEEQLLDAYSRSIVVSASEVCVKPSVQAVLPRRLVNGIWARSLVASDNIDTVICLSALLASMSPAALSMHLSTLRRDIMTHCIDYVLKQPVQIYQAHPSDLTGTSAHTLSLQRAPPGTEDLVLRLSHLTAVITFLNAHLFPHLPPPERKSFPLSLCTHIRTSLLNHLLLPNLPSSLSKLPDFLRIANRAVEIEDTIVVKMLGDNGVDRSIQSWVDGVGLHYERKRRADILDRARVIVVSSHDDSNAFRVEMPLVIEEEKPIPVQVDEKPVTNGGTHAQEGSVPPEGDTAWGFEDETQNQSEQYSADGWSFDDDIEPEPEPEVQPEPRPEPELTKVAEPPQEIEEQEDDPWALDDAAPPEPEDESPWDDAWDEKPAVPDPVPPSPAPKPAKGLEKKLGGKSVPNSPAFPPPHSPAVSSPPQPPPPAVASQRPIPALAPLRPVQVTETYLVSGRTKELLQLVEDVLREGAELVSSGILGGSPGNVIIQAAPMALELFRALVPVTNAALLKQSPKEAMRFSNDCLYVENELRRILAGLSEPKAGTGDKLEDGLERLRVLADSWFEDAIVRVLMLRDDGANH